MARKASIIAGFPGVGKSYTVKSLGIRHYNIVDLDSSSFSWDKGGNRSPLFPKNYIEAVKELSSKADIIFVSTHDNVRDELKRQGMPYTVVHPTRELKEEYLERYRKRGDNNKFIELMDSNWDTFIESIENDSYPRKLRIGAGQYIFDVLNVLYV